MESSVLVRWYSLGGGCGRRALDLGDGQRGRAAVGRCLLVGVVGRDGSWVGGFGRRGCGGQECVGGRREGGVPRPGPVAARLGFIQAGGLFRVLIIVLDRPAGAGGLDRVGQGAGVVVRGVGDIVGWLGRVAGLPADQQAVAIHARWYGRRPLGPFPHERQFQPRASTGCSAWPARIFTRPQVVG